MDKSEQKEHLERIKELHWKPLQDKYSKGVLEERFNDESKYMRERDDGQYQRDYTRILYASSFRRLQGKMQLFGIKNDQFFRNRLTHSLEVAQIARSIADMIGYNTHESYVVEAGALAHDIGNPPFGHAGERYLNTLAKDFGGFEGNAQTLRILTTVEQKRFDFQGLNLTKRTLLSVVKYYREYNQNLEDNKFNKQKFLYNDDYDLINDIIRKSGIKVRTLDVQIVDLADEIAYAAHDLEDGLRQNIFTTDEILHDFFKTYDDCEAAKELERIFIDNKVSAGFKNKNVDSSEFIKLYRKEITSEIINTLIRDIGLVYVDKDFKDKTGTANEYELGFVKLEKLASGLKETTYKCINHNDEVYMYENRGEMILNDLYEFYINNDNYLPSEYRADILMDQYDSIKNNKKFDKEIFQKRLVVDYISGMMDNYAESLHEKLIRNNMIK